MDYIIYIKDTGKWEEIAIVHSYAKALTICDMIAGETKIMVRN